MGAGPAVPSKDDELRRVEPQSLALLLEPTEISSENYERPEYDFEVSWVVTSQRRRCRLVESLFDVLGMTFVAMDNRWLVVDSIRESGHVPQWNNENSYRPDVIMFPGDVIVEVNGFWSDTSQMMGSLQEDRVCLRVKRGDNIMEREQSEYELEVLLPAAAEGLHV
eukprot:TRINITY_DN45299_c0_g1_i1.p1 TRINITY_DN45299_c0_g1~~TRINITY_DN45299_c0_g1_i1.p1  ORF type:complete len:166 (-),score=32.49 TRINITY_DN45299_c0_g1_i1:87-584(-)